MDAKAREALLDAAMEVYWAADDGGTRGGLRAAMAVIEPVIRAAEIAACAEIALMEHLAATNNEESESNQDLVSRLKSQGGADSANRIYVTIRARGADNG